MVCALDGILASGDAALVAHSIVGKPRLREAKQLPKVWEQDSYGAVQFQARET